MGRKRNTFIRDFFVVDGNKAMCKNCDGSYNAQSTTNLKRHLAKEHSEMLKQFEKQNREEASAECSSSKKRKTDVVKVQFEVCKDTFIKNCINFVTKQNLPFSFFDSEEFKYLTEATFKFLDKDPITSRNIMDYVAEKYNKLKQELIQKIRNRMLCIKIDAATRLNRSVLGINVQVLEENEVKIFTLAMIEIKARHTGENLKAEVERVLNGFFVKKSQIYSITTDNGRNLLKCVDQLSVEAETDWEDQLRAEDRCDILSESISFDRITSIKCAAHTLQLAVNDFLKESERATIVDQARNVVKVLRTTTLGLAKFSYSFYIQYLMIIFTFPLCYMYRYRYQLEQNNLRKPPIDVATRWGSTYKMLKGLMELRDFCADNWRTIGSSKELREEDWNAIGDVVNVLAPLHELTLKLQKSQLLLGDFYKHWLELICQMEDLNSDMSKKVIHYLRIREKGLLEHDTMYAALFLDPRFRRLISVEKLARASQHLKKLVVKMHHLTQV